MDTEYPKMLYRAGSEIVWDGRDLDTRIVTSADDELAALDEGWTADGIAPAKPEPKKPALKAA